MSDCIILSIQSDHAKRIYSGRKRAELRKAFAQGVRLVFLYETLPVGAITGVFTVASAINTTVPHAVRLAKLGGVTAQRARRYYGEREHGWVVTPGVVVQFPKPVSMAWMRHRLPGFQPPQSYSYLSRSEPVAHELIRLFAVGIGSRLQLHSLRATNRPAFGALIRTEVGNSYEDIDADFLQQVMNKSVGIEAAFSTRKKHLLEVRAGKQLLGFSVLTQKTHRAWKSGPTVLLPEYRGLGIGNAVRMSLKEYCAERGAQSIYCTCPATRPQVVAYLLNAGMQLQARLREHLSRGRDEFVFAQRIVASKPSQARERRFKMREQAGEVIVTRMRADDVGCKAAISFFVKNMATWYFAAGQRLERAVLSGMRAQERDARRYSAKSRLMFVARAADNKLLAVAVGTVKRSGMLKLNVVGRSGHSQVYESLLCEVVKATRQFRRLYITVPAGAGIVVEALTACGFVCEGALDAPFGGEDHVCLGLVRSRLT